MGKRGAEMKSSSNEYLRPTALCDSDSRIIRRLASEITASASDPAESSLRIFRHVRDGIAFNATLDIFLKASQAAARKTIDFCNKINIHAALLRAAGVPARFHTVRMRKEILRHIVPGFLYAHLPENVGHFWCECRLKGKWIACEALFDKPFYEGMLREGWIRKEQIPTIDWDGENDLILLRHWMTADGDICSRYEDITGLALAEGMPPKIVCRWLEWLPAFVGGRQTDRVRRS
jgi:hypothetical protein